MEVKELLLSLGLRPLLRGLASPMVWALALAGLTGLWLPGKSLPVLAWDIAWFFCAPFVEELTWRAIVQNEICRCFPGGRPFSYANLAASALFALCHFALAPSLMAALVFFPSLVFGLLWTKFHSTWLCGIMHCWYNLALRL